jgi:adenosylhomocysteine nucleosidase
LNGTGVVAALSVEARALGRPQQHNAGLSVLRDGTLVGVSGIGCAAAARCARALADAGATALVSFGMAGGLDPVLRAGTVCLPIEIISRQGASILTAQRWREAVSGALGGIETVGKLLTSTQAIDTIAGKARAFLETGAAVVDMESLGVAQVAAAQGLPFIAVRVVVDTAGDVLPGAMVAASREGELRIWQFIRGLARSPADIATVFRLAQRYRAAIRALGDVARSGALAPGASA